MTNMSSSPSALSLLKDHVSMGQAALYSSREGLCCGVEVSFPLVKSCQGRHPRKKGLKRSSAYMVLGRLGAHRALTETVKGIMSISLLF